MDDNTKQALTYAVAKYIEDALDFEGCEGCGVMGNDSILTTAKQIITFLFTVKTREEEAEAAATQFNLGWKMGYECAVNEQDEEE